MYRSNFAFMRGVGVRIFQFFLGGGCLVRLGYVFGCIFEHFPPTPPPTTLGRGSG